METLNKLSMAVFSAIVQTIGLIFMFGLISVAFIYPRLQMNNPDLHFAALVRMGLSHHHTCGVRHWLQPSSTP